VLGLWRGWIGWRGGALRGRLRGRFSGGFRSCGAVRRGARGVDARVSRREVKGGGSEGRGGKGEEERDGGWRGGRVTQSCRHRARAR